jgi:uncharacterized tellurite resistance protein B-like protein
MLFLSSAVETPPTTTAAADGTALALLVFIAAIAAWLGIRALVRRIRAGKTEAVVHGSFAEYALEALVNAAKLDGRVAQAERAAIAAAMREIAGAAFEASAVDAVFARTALTKDELVAYLAAKSVAFSNAQKMSLLKALLAVFVADGRFDETEHHALVEYTAAVGFDRQSAPAMLAGLSRDFARGRIT